jgi:hypothetical protein
MIVLQLVWFQSLPKSYSSNLNSSDLVCSLLKVIVLHLEQFWSIIFIAQVMVLQLEWFSSSMFIAKVIFLQLEQFWSIMFIAQVIVKETIKISVILHDSKSWFIFMLYIYIAHRNSPNGKYIFDASMLWKEMVDILLVTFLELS